MRKISKAVLYPPGDGDHDARPRGISGATITSWDGSHEIDLVALLSRSGDQVSIAGAASAPVNNHVQRAADSPDDSLLKFASVGEFLTVAIV
jgi:hypothetical protein